MKKNKRICLIAMKTHTEKYTKMAIRTYLTTLAVSTQIMIINYIDTEQQQTNRSIPKTRKNCINAIYSY